MQTRSKTRSQTKLISPKQHVPGKNQIVMNASPHVKSVKMSVPNPGDVCYLMVKNISPTTKEDELKAVFEIYGSICDMFVIRDKNQLAKTGLVSFEDPKDVDVAVSSFSKSGYSKDGYAWTVGRIAAEVAKNALAAHGFNMHPSQRASLDSAVKAKTETKAKPQASKKAETKAKPPASKNSRKSEVKTKKAQAATKSVSLDSDFTQAKGEFHCSIKKPIKMKKFEELDAESFHLKEVDYLSAQISSLIVQKTELQAEVCNMENTVGTLVVQKASLQADIWNLESKLGKLEVADKLCAVMSIVLSYMSA